MPYDGRVAFCCAATINKLDFGPRVNPNRFASFNKGKTTMKHFFDKLVQFFSATDQASRWNSSQESEIFIRDI